MQEHDPRHVYQSVHDELMLGGMALKRRWEAKRRAAGQSIDKPNLITGPVQICWHKFTPYWE